MRRLGLATAIDLDNVERLIYDGEDEDEVLTVTSSAGGGVLDFFFDLDQDGTFGNNAIEVYTATLTGGTQSVPVFLPFLTPGGDTFARFRISTAGGLGPRGQAADRPRRECSRARDQPAHDGGLVGAGGLAQGSR